MMGTEIFKIDASWAEKLRKTRVSFLTAPTVYASYRIGTKPFKWERKIKLKLATPL